MPELAKECIASWKKHMPDWEYKRWDESNFDIAAAPQYVKQAYEARKFAFVSDYVRLWALEQYGGLYMDVDFEVFRPFDDLMDKYPAFAGYEGSKRQPVMQGVIASEPHGAWVTDMLRTYETRVFVKEDGSLDLTPNTSFFTDRLEAQGFVADGVEKDFYIEENIKNIDKNTENTLLEVTKNAHPESVMANSPECNQSQPLTNKLAASVPDTTPSNPNSDSVAGCLQKNVIFDNSQKNDKNGHAGGTFMLHVFPVHYFCPVLTTGEDVRTEETYCEHKGESSWAQTTWKAKILGMVSPKMRTRLIKLKRSLLG